MPRSVFLSDEEDQRIARVAANLTIERGKTHSKSAIMREAILWYMGLNEVSNGKGKVICKKKKLTKLRREPRNNWYPNPRKMAPR